MTEFANQARSVIGQLLVNQDAALTETMELLRVDGARCRTDLLWAEIKVLSRTAVTEHFGQVSVIGDISGEVDVEHASLQAVEGEALTFRILKRHEPGWCYFLTEGGLGNSLNDPGFVAVRRFIWIAGTFESFSSHSHRFVPWDTAIDQPPAIEELAKPRKLVRDLTARFTPADVSPWLLKTPPAANSDPFQVWQRHAFDQLAFCIPSEIRSDNGDTIVAPKGPRSVAIPLDAQFLVCTFPQFLTLSEALYWIYAQPKDADTKFAFLNNQLSLNWRDGETWPSGLFAVLENAIQAAKADLAFYLQDQSKELLKTLTDLRKALQDDVAKVQQSTRDLVFALWRDFAVAGVVLALRTPSSPVPKDVLRVLTLGTAGLLLVSILVTTLGNARFNWLAKKSREDWRNRLYPFVSVNDWRSLVLQPLRKSQRAYRSVLLVIFAVYVLIIGYLVSMTLPHSTFNWVPPSLS